VWAPVRSVAFKLDRDWSAVWTSLDAGLQALPATGHDSRAAVTRPGSPRGQALVTCALTTLHLRRTPTLVGPAPSSPPATPYSVVPPTPSPSPTATPPGGRQEQGLRGLSGLDAVQMTWNPITTACSDDWQRSDRSLAADRPSVVRWWTAWQRADDWLAQVAPDLQWLDHDGDVALRLGS
jgi:hypothetical protein